MRIGKFGFLNNFLPYYWIEKFKKAELIETTPKGMIEMIERRELDFAPIPSFYFLKNRNRFKSYRFCIGSKREVLSVLVVSSKENPDYRIALTSESVTSVNLLKIILREKGLNYKLIPTNWKSADDLLRLCECALVIGDEAIRARMKYRVVMDLGTEWFELTGYPMIFGISVSLRDVDARRCDELLMHSIKWGFENFYEVVSNAKKLSGVDEQFLKRYFRSLTYRMGYKERKGLDVFEELCREHGLL